MYIHVHILPLTPTYDTVAMKVSTGTLPDITAIDKPRKI